MRPQIKNNRSRFNILDTQFCGLRVLVRQPISDSRGFFERLFCMEELKEIVPDKHIVQINHTNTNKKGIVRGLHYQRAPYSEIKCISCLRGEVFDVVVDLRMDSPTYLQWHSELLSEKNYKTIIVPEGFAHGFQSLTDDCEMLYFHTSEFNPESEAGLNARDPRLSISWPLEITEQSLRDKLHPFLKDEFYGDAT